MRNDDNDSYEPDHEHVQESANQRRNERTDTVEDMLGDVGMLEEDKYPATSEELAVEYADQELDLPNETESLGSVFDRIVDERFDSPDEAREAVLHELTGAASGSQEYNEERGVDQIDEDAQELGNVNDDE